MQQIDFHFNVANRSLYACLLIKKVTGMGLTVAVWSSDNFLLKKAYDDLWRFEDLTFIAHAWAGSEYETLAGVVFGENLSKLPARYVLVLLDENVPPNWQEQFSRFDRIVDIVSNDDREVANARQRYRVYHAASDKLQAYDRSRS